MTVEATRLAQRAVRGRAVRGIATGRNTRSALTQAGQSGSPNCQSTPQPSTSTATTAGGSPQCTEQAISNGVNAAQSGQTVGSFECSGDWAFAEVTMPGPNSFEYTALLNWHGSSWVSVDRATYCENGSVPQNIYQPACESN